LSSREARERGSAGERGDAEPAPRERPAAAKPTMVNIGYGNLVMAGRVIAIVLPGSSPMRRLREEASKRGKLLDATEGRRTRSIVLTDSDHVILSAITPETIATRLAPDFDGELEA
jgi:regulator of extracellular matrix RemA (YlzA/DUF370 family)